MRLVDADELIEIAHRIRLDSRERIERMIESAPTIDPVKHGYWVETNQLDGYAESDFIFNGECKCSVCGFSVGPNHAIPTTTPYCPNCGAKMEGENNGF